MSNTGMTDVDRRSESIGALTTWSFDIGSFDRVSNQSCHPDGASAVPVVVVRSPLPPVPLVFTHLPWPPSRSVFEGWGVGKETVPS